MPSTDQTNTKGSGTMLEALGISITQLEKSEVKAEMVVNPSLLAPNGFLHAACIVALADSAAGYGCTVNLPENADRFATIELKSNFVGTAREGLIDCVARPMHMGKTTQVWDAHVTSNVDGQTLAFFRCTQMILQAG